jgi:BolA family transcriptional regulator, general stress-responsive regulator
MQIFRLFSKVSQKIQSKLQYFNPNHLEVIDESWMHEIGKETHFKILIVSDQFQDQTVIKRECMVAKQLEEIWTMNVRTISMVTQTPEEYEKYKSNKFIYEYPDNN